MSGDGELEVHLGILFAFYSLSLTFEVIKRVITGDQLSFSDLESFKPPKEVISEIGRLMDAWDESSRTGWARAILPARVGRSSKVDANVADMVERGMTYIVVGHELTHWFETIYKDAEWGRMMTEVEGHLSTWLAEERKLVSPQVLANVRKLLKDPAAPDSWVREIHADCGAFDFFYASSTHGGWSASSEDLMRANIHMSFFFALLSLFEVHAQNSGVDLDVTTHPPAVIRRAVFCHIMAKRHGMSQQDFMLIQFGAGFAVGCLMEAIIAEYVKTRGRRT